MWPFKRKPIRVEVVRRDESKLRLLEWNQDDRLCHLGAKMLANPDLQLMLSVLKNEHPSKTVLHYGTNLDVRAVWQARSEGYEMCLANLEALGTSVKPIPLPEPMFAAEE